MKTETRIPGRLEQLYEEKINCIDTVLKKTLSDFFSHKEETEKTILLQVHLSKASLRWLSLYINQPLMFCQHFNENGCIDHKLMALANTCKINSKVEDFARNV